MSKENILFSLIGLGFGLFAGFVFANSVNQRALSPRSDVTTLAASAQGGAATDATDMPAADPQQMQAQVQAAIKRAQDEPNNFDAQMETAQLYYQIQRFDDAMKFLRRANQLKPDEPAPMVALGNVNYDAGRYVEAEKWYAAALAKQPDDISVRTDLGLTFLLRQPPDYDRAIAEFRRSLERDPRHEPSLQNLAVALTKKGNVSEARATLAKLEGINPQNPALPQLRSNLDTGNAPGASAPK